MKLNCLVIKSLIEMNGLISDKSAISSQIKVNSRGWRRRCSIASDKTVNAMYHFVPGFMKPTFLVINV